jgi:hypothetical protein
MPMKAALAWGHPMMSPLLTSARTNVLQWLSAHLLGANLAPSTGSTSPPLSWGGWVACLICLNHHLAQRDIISSQSTVTGVREELGISQYPLYPCNPVPLLPFCGIVFSLECSHIRLPPRRWMQRKMGGGEDRGRGS